MGRSLHILILIFMIICFRLTKADFFMRDGSCLYMMFARCYPSHKCERFAAMGEKIKTSGESGGRYMSQIRVSNLTFAYEGSPYDVLKNVSFNIDTDWKLGLIGRNGKGKTTLCIFCWENILIREALYQVFILIIFHLR